MKLGIIDSGTGGLYCASKVRKLYHNVDLFLLMDKNNLPYGEKSADELAEILASTFKFMEENGVSFIFIACNTLSAVYEEHKDNYPDFKVISMVDFYNDIKEHVYSDVAFLGTTYSANSAVFKKLLPKKFTEFIPSIALAAAIENNNEKSINSELNLLNLPSKPTILGCTHFPLVADKISAITKRPCLDPMVYLPNVLLLDDIGNATNEININGDHEINPAFENLLPNATIKKVTI